MRAYGLLRKELGEVTKARANKAGKKRARQHAKKQCAGREGLIPDWIDGASLFSKITIGSQG